MLRAIERQVEEVRGEVKRYEVQLPLLRSKRSGALRSMTNAEIEDLLG